MFYISCMKLIVATTQCFQNSEVEPWFFDFTTTRDIDMDQFAKNYICLLWKLHSDANPNFRNSK